MAHKLVEKSQVGPAIRRTTSLSLTFLDLPWAGPIHVRRQFFYPFPHSTHHFFETNLPTLKRSLSLALQRFFPLAGNLMCPPPPHKPFIRCTDDDFVTLTIIESKADFNHLSSNQPKNLKELDHLVPKLTCTTIHEEDTFIFPLVALQVTIFPNHGLCMAITYCHVMDDRCCSHFMKSWSSICRSGGVDLTIVEKSPPCFDREVLKDPRGLEAIFLRDYFEERSTWKDKLIIGQNPKRACDDEDYVKATIVFGRDDIEGLKRWVLNQWTENDEFKAPKYISKFVVTCAFVWASLVNARYQNDEKEVTKEEQFHFGFAADCRDRFEYPVPETYFGNCLMMCHAELKKKELKGGGGFVNAVKAIESAVSSVTNKPFEGAENWRATFRKMYALESTVLVNGSPKFNVYKTDFGFGRPTKVDMVHPFKCMSLSESGDKEGGLEVGLVFRSGEFEYFNFIIEQGLEASKLFGAHKLVESFEVGPAKPIDSRDKTTTSFPLSFLDLHLVGPIYVRRQFFYHFPYSTHHFCKTTLPTLKTSLSQTLQHFFPLAGNLLCPPPPHKPFIRCTDDDSITFTIIESEADFNHLSSNHPKNLKDLDHLVPKLTCTNTQDDTFIFPLVALQATVFPNHGLCIAITYCHVMDDSSCSHFMKSWSSICRSGVVDLKSPPCFDREVLKDPRELEAIFLREYFEERSTWKDKLVGPTSELSSGYQDYVKATIVFRKEEIEGLKKWVLNQWEKNDAFNTPQYLSKFVVACAFVWASLVKTRCRNDDEEELKEEYFRFAADCRGRLEYPVPETYFGNCLTLCNAMLKRKELKGECGFVNAVKVIERAVTDMKNKPFRDAENWKGSFTKMFVLGSTLLVTGSPKFTVYETDFGFGRPIKVEMLHSFKGMSLAESGDEEGGLEVGLVFRDMEFGYLISVIQQGLQASKS
ncbi:uncharacterized protein LOC113855905 [Abrus precatorius]|uniref:Uncharacterized protein LOC113855905 n=1 Tax=Abrus precatorius TaxID=3816 RepID=A0A8B8KHP1_ABRPR|nr:uncharacterized protein LOC113855905 [Abrus precatorius]